MPRYAREISETGVYHVMVRGIDKSDVFLDDMDRARYLETLAKVKSDRGIKLHAYCLMNNHVHLLLSEGDEPVGESMRRIGTSYAFWFNIRYGRVGHLFQGRFVSEAVDTDDYFSTVFRYIHQNPVKAGLCQTARGYRWSSYAAYSHGRQLISGIVDTDLACSILGGKHALLKFTDTANEDRCLDVQEKLRASDEDIIAQLQQMLGGMPASSIMDMNVPDRNRLLARLKLTGASIRQLVRLTGVGKSIIERA